MFWQILKKDDTIWWWTYNKFEIYNWQSFLIFIGSGILFSLPKYFSFSYLVNCKKHSSDQGELQSRPPDAIIYIYDPTIKFPCVWPGTFSASKEAKIQRKWQKFHTRLSFGFIFWSDAYFSVPFSQVIYVYIALHIKTNMDNICVDIKSGNYGQIQSRR